MRCGRSPGAGPRSDPTLVSGPRPGQPASANRTGSGYYTVRTLATRCDQPCILCVKAGFSWHCAQVPMNGAGEVEYHRFMAIHS